MNLGSPSDVEKVGWVEIRLLVREQVIAKPRLLSLWARVYYVSAQWRITGSGVLSAA